MTQAEICDKLFFDETFKKWFRIGKQSNEAQNAPIINHDLDWEYEIRDPEIYFKMFYEDLYKWDSDIKEYWTPVEYDYFKIGWEHAEF